MSKKILTHEEIQRFDGMAGRVSSAVHDRVDFLRRRTLELNGQTADREAFNGLGQTLTSMLSDPHREKDATKRLELIKARATQTFEFCELVKKARTGDMEAVQELNALWMETINLYIRAKSNFLMFFRPVTLQPNEQVCYESTYNNEIDVSYIGQDGGPRTRKAVAAKKQTFFDMKELHSEEVGYQIRDINLGPDIATMAQKTVDIAWDMEAKLNDLAKTLYLTLLGSFTTTGAKLSRTYIPNQYIVGANLPTTNVLSATSNGPTTLFRMDCIRKIARYAGQWADVWGQPITPTGVILISSKDALDLSEELIPTGATNNSTADKIIAGDYLEVAWMGRNWKLVPDVTIASGVAYPVLGQPVGDYFSKPGVDESFVETNRKKNWETRSAMKVVQFASPQPKRVNACSITYHT